jgi:hypothetical protein
MAGIVLLNQKFIQNFQFILPPEKQEPLLAKNVP